MLEGALQRRNLSQPRDPVWVALHVHQHLREPLAVSALAQPSDERTVSLRAGEYVQEFAGAAWAEDGDDLFTEGFGR